MRRVLVALSLLAAVHGSAAAAPFRVKNGLSVRVAVAGQRERGVGLKPAASGGWRLELAGGAQLADVFDVTPGVAPTRWTVPVIDGALALDEARFAAGHAYRVKLRHGIETVGSTLVYLYPGRAAVNRRVDFDDDAATAADDGIAIAPKSSL